VAWFEMIDGASRVSRERGEAPRNTVGEAGRQLGWALRDAAMTGMATPLDAQLGGRVAPAFMVHSWATSCRDDFTFSTVHPHLQTLAESVNPQITAAGAAQMWAWIAASPCGRKLSANDRKWIELYTAIARREPRAMVAASRAVLEVTPGPGTPATETAVLAGALGLICQGDSKGADAFLTQMARRYFRRDVRQAELRYLYGLNNGSPTLRKPDGVCTAGVNAAAAPPAVTSGARRSP